MDWYAAQTKPRYERIVSECCERDEIINYVPWVQEDVRRHRNNRPSGNLRHVVYPLINGFVFVRSDSPLKLVARMTGFLKWVEFANQPGVVTEQEIETMKLACKPEYKPQPMMEFLPGSEVVVLNGPFKGNKGKVLSQGSGFVKLQIGVGFLGGFSVQIPAEDLR